MWIKPYLLSFIAVCLLPVAVISQGSSDACKCGLANRKKSFNRIVGGQVTEVNEYPWMAGIAKISEPTKPFCGGSVIGDKWILTAAHCLFTGYVPKQMGELQVILGEHDWTKDYETTLVRKNIVKIINHPSYDRRSAINSKDYDYSLLELDSAIDFATNSHIRPVCLPSGSSTYAGDTAIATGWGIEYFQTLEEMETDTSRPQQSPQLKEVIVNVMTNSDCTGSKTDYSASKITSRMICAGDLVEGGRDACSSDSGGPLVSSGTGDGNTPGSNYELIGVVSWGNECGLARSPGVYARVTEAMDWINSATAGTLNTCPRTDGVPTQCQSGNYKILSDATRSTSYSIKTDSEKKCDVLNQSYSSPSWKGPGWYKFANPAGTKMATSAPRFNRCGAYRTGYMVDQHPTEVGQTKQVKFCFSWKGTSCGRSTQGEVTKCGEGNFVYKLPNAPICTARYCAVP